MGLDAFVNCNCLFEGKAKDPPFPPAQMYFDSEGSLAVRGREDNNNVNDLLSDWREHACEHPDMEFAHERIANWGGLRAFQDALVKVGAESFPVLLHGIPAVNGGTMAPAAAGQAILELDAFLQHKDIGEITCLVDAETGTVLQERIEQYDGLFAHGPGYMMCLRNGEFEIVLGDNEEGIVFHSKRFEQILPNPLIRFWQHFICRSYNSRLLFSDIERGDSYRATIPALGYETPWPDGRMTNGAGEVRQTYPRFLKVEKRADSVERYRYIIDPLYTIFHAAVATGNPVQWS
jgi:hypothetical protein